MNLYQRKTLLIILAINLVFGLQQYLVNGAVVFPSPINSFLFLVATVFFFILTIFKSTRLEKWLLILFLLTAIIQFCSDSFVLEIFLSSKHATVYEWMNSDVFALMQIIGVSMLLGTIPLIAISLKTINPIYTYLLLFILVVLGLLAYVKLPFEPLIILGLFSLLLFFLLRKHEQNLYAGVSAAMHLWMIYFFQECFEFWNLNL
jgi:hypothetical protein